MIDTIKKILFIFIALVVTFLPWVCDILFPAWHVTNYAPGAAIILGVIFTAIFDNPMQSITTKLVSPLLGATIVGMGFGMDLVKVIHEGGSGFFYTVIGIAAGLIIGLWLGRRLRLTPNTSMLISIGTSICGGSAIAASAPVIQAKSHEIALATATIFLLNGVALLIFPPIGHALGFDEIQFGTWSALAIHDTSSVVGASLAYGEQALETGVTIKLARALWIIPVTLMLSIWEGSHASSEGPTKIKIRVPWFIPGFIVAAAIVTFLPKYLGDAGAYVKVGGEFLKTLSKYVMILTLFLVGANLSLKKLKEVGIAPFLHGIILWIVLGTAWCLAIYFGVIARHKDPEVVAKQTKIEVKAVPENERAISSPAPSQPTEPTTIAPVTEVDSPADYRAPEGTTTTVIR